MTTGLRQGSSGETHPPTWQLCASLMRLHHFPVGTKLPFTALALSMYMGTKGVDTSYSTNFSYAKAGLWWLFIFIRHSGGCVWDDICDRDIDRLVERTKDRPLASRKITLQGACWLLSTLLCLTLLLLHAICQNVILFFLGLAGLAIVDMPYPLMKRYVNLPQLVIGLSTAWPMPIAWMSVTGGRYDTGTLSMLCIAFCGITFVLDTIYACQDIDEDTQFGMKSSAIFFKGCLRRTLSFVTAAIAISLFAAGILNGRGYLYCVVSTGGVTTCLIWHIISTNFSNKDQCAKALAAYSNGINAAIWAGMIVDCISTM